MQPEDQATTEARQHPPGLEPCDDERCLLNVGSPHAISECPTQPVKASDLEVRDRQALTEQDIAMAGAVECPWCEGSGIQPGQNWKHDPHSGNCPSCKEGCELCHGTGIALLTELAKFVRVNFHSIGAALLDDNAKNAEMYRQDVRAALEKLIETLAEGYSQEGIDAS